MSKLDLLTANDQSGEYPRSFYASAINPVRFEALKGHERADACIIGGGFTGLSAAISLAELGFDVVLLEAQRVGFGASGRNGGQIGTGQRIDALALTERYGAERAKKLLELGTAAQKFTINEANRLGIDIGYQPGIASLMRRQRDVEHANKVAEFQSQLVEYQHYTRIDASNIREFIGSDQYLGGVVDWSSGHGDPLVLAIGLGEAARARGVRIYENSTVTSISPSIKTAGGQVDAEFSLLACNGYLGDLHPVMARHIMPINNFIIATEPLGVDRARSLIPRNTAIVDDRFVVNYFRLSPDNRLLFGGGESYGYRFPKDILGKARGPMLKVFPELKDVKIDYAWGGTLAITRNRLPYIRRTGNLFVAAGYSGHGVALANYMGHLIAKAISGDSAPFDLMASIDHKSFPGGAMARQPLLASAMLWYQMRDRLGI